MSMLAEPRRKQKVINLRAKNNAWSNDNTKFGQRMLERMGWSSGKGLGAKENGIVEHVVARYKNDEKGLGFEDRSDQWTKHEDDFNSLLANLSNADNNNETLHSGVSLEKKSKTSKTRIHYHKFTRGKDLSRYSEKDLANIFGKKSFKEPKVEEVMKEDTIKTTEQVFTEKGNMDDYFKTKMAAFKSKSKINTDIESKDLVTDFSFKGFSNYTKPENESKDLVSDFAFKGVSNYTEPENESKDLVSDFAFKGVSNYTEQENRSKDLVSDFAFKGFSNYTKPDNGGKQNGSGYQPFSFYSSQNKGENQVELCPDGETKSKKKKKSKQKEEPSEELVENNITECTKNVTQNVVPDEQAPEQIKVKKSKKKKHQKYTEDNIELVVEAGENLFTCAQEAAEIVTADVEQKVKKSKKKKGQECLHNIQVLEAKENSSECSQEVSQGNESSKKSRKNRVQNLAAEKIQVYEMKQKKKNKNCVQDDIQKDVFMEDAVPKKKKKRKNHVI